MKLFCQLIGLSISMRTMLALRLRGVSVHQACIFPQRSISFANNADSRVQKPLLAWWVLLLVLAGEHPHSSALKNSTQL